jgi:hypothetical protein
MLSGLRIKHFPSHSLPWKKPHNSYFDCGHGGLTHLGFQSGFFTLSRRAVPQIFGHRKNFLPQYAGSLRWHAIGGDLLYALFFYRRISFIRGASNELQIASNFPATTKKFIDTYYHSER